MPKENNMFDGAIKSLILDSVNKNRSTWFDAYINGKPIIMLSDGSVKIIEPSDFYKQHKVNRDGYEFRP